MPPEPQAGDRVILRGVSRTVLAGQRIGILGANGQGKSTFVKTIARTLPLLGGTVTEGKGLAIGYFAQQELDVLHADSTPLEHMVRLARDTGRAHTEEAREQQLRNFLGSFSFPGEMVTQRVGQFSGGEKARLVLAMIVWQRPNLLLLDEPTNHLDLEMRHALTMALQDYEGAMVLVSHDRALLRATCDRFLLVDGGRIQPFDGDLDDYRDWLASRRAEVAAAAACPDQAADKAARKADRAQAAADRQARLAARRPLVKELEQIDKRMAAWNKEKAELDARLADPALYTGPQAGEVPALNKRQAELAERIEEAELRWLELHEALEAIPAD